MVADISLTCPKPCLYRNPISNSSFFGKSFKGFGLQVRPSKIERKKKELVQLMVTAASASTSAGSPGDRFYFNITGFPFPLGPFLNRSTIRTEASGFRFRQFLLVQFFF